MLLQNSVDQRLHGSSIFFSSDSSAVMHWAESSIFSKCPSSQTWSPVALGNISKYVFGDFILVAMGLLVNHVIYWSFFLVPSLFYTFIIRRCWSSCFQKIPLFYWTSWGSIPIYILLTLKWVPLLTVVSNWLFYCPFTNLTSMLPFMMPWLLVGLFDACTNNFVFCVPW